MAMGEAITDAFNIGKRVQSRRNFTRLLNSISSTPEAIVVIPDDNVQQSEGNQGATKQPEVLIQPIPQTPSDISPPGGFGDTERRQTPTRCKFLSLRAMSRV